MSLDNRLRDDAAALEEDLRRVRHEIHRAPEIGLHLPRTQETILRELNGLGMEISTGTSLSSVTAVLRGTGGGTATVLLRGDMDALPVKEDTGLAFASQLDGAMHACGHDLHVAMLLGAAKLLSAHRDQLKGDVVFMFQPGEEGMDGAGHMIEEGVLDAAGRRADSAYGMHVFSGRYPRGTFTTRPGTLMAASDGLHVTMHGAGAHGSTPFLGLDPVAALANVISGLQTLVTRRFDVFDPVVVTVGMIRAGTRRNIVPDDAYFEATVRSFSSAARDKIRELAPKLCTAVAESQGLTADVEYIDEYPVTVNHAEHAQFVADVAREVFGGRRYNPLPFPDAGAEDFSRVLEQVPGTYMFLGACPTDDYANAPSNHSPRAAFSDEVLADGALMHAQLGVRALARDNKEARWESG